MVRLRILPRRTPPAGSARLTPNRCLTLANQASCRDGTSTPSVAHSTPAWLTTWQCRQMEMSGYCSPRVIVGVSHRASQGSGQAPPAPPISFTCHALRRVSACVVQPHFRVAEGVAHTAQPRRRRRSGGPCRRSHPCRCHREHGRHRSCHQRGVRRRRQHRRPLQERLRRALQPHRRRHLGDRLVGPTALGEQHGCRCCHRALGFGPGPWVLPRQAGERHRRRRRPAHPERHRNVQHERWRRAGVAGEHDHCADASRGQHPHGRPGRRLRRGRLEQHVVRDRTYRNVHQHAGRCTQRVEC